MGIHSVGIEFAGVFEGAMVGAIISPCAATPLIEGIDATYLASDKKRSRKKESVIFKRRYKKSIFGKKSKVIPRQLVRK